jgi:hypothetical protein
MEKMTDVMKLSQKTPLLNVAAMGMVSFVQHLKHIMDSGKLLPAA